jgi:hypothetical protein
MAFLVCYSGSLDDHTRNRAVYLDQTFYELIFALCREERGGYSVLREIALLRYKSPTIIVGQTRLRLLADELNTLSASGVTHPQIAEFGRVCAQAQADGCSLTISGDMYPEL